LYADYIFVFGIPFFLFSHGREKFMSLPSISKIAERMGISLVNPSDEQRETVLVEAMRQDMPEAVALLERTSDAAQANGGEADWIEDPQSVIGKQLIRIHAGDALRQLASKHFCSGKPLTFFNCCGGKVGEGKIKRTLGELMNLQIQMQDGTIARADC
jgi:hypothetical protein